METRIFCDVINCRHNDGIYCLSSVISVDRSVKCRMMKPKGGLQPDSGIRATEMFIESIGLARELEDMRGQSAELKGTGGIRRTRVYDVVAACAVPTVCG